MTSEDMTQKRIDDFYKQHGKCCAGRDNWGWITASVGECKKSPPVGELERVSLLNIKGLTLSIGAGQIMTQRDYLCGDFVDTYDWGEI